MAERLAAAGTGEKTTLVEDGTEFKGSFTSKCPIVVRGKVEGDVSAPSLTISPTGAVYGKARVGQIHSEGEISGEFDADVIELSGKVKDNTVIRAKSLNIKLSPDKGKMQVVFGECTLEVGEEPTHTAATTGKSPAASSDDFGPILSRGKASNPPPEPNGGS